MNKCRFNSTNRSTPSKSIGFNSIFNLFKQHLKHKPFLKENLYVTYIRLLLMRNHGMNSNSTPKPT